MKLAFQSLLLMLVIFLVFFGHTALRRASVHYGRAAVAAVDYTYAPLKRQSWSSLDCRVTFTYQPASSGRKVQTSDTVDLSACSSLRAGDRLPVHYFDAGPLRSWASLDDDFGQKKWRAILFVTMALLMLFGLSFLSPKA